MIDWISQFFIINSAVKSLFVRIDFYSIFFQPILINFEVRRIFLQKKSITQSRSTELLN